MSEPTKAVFLSYASQDAEAAKRLADALRAAGVEVWFDQSELVGGDQWDQKIRKQIRECGLFIPVISKTTQGRREAYFRLEWKLADERTHLMARGTPYILPVTIDDTDDRGALVPDSFLAVQWTKAPGGEVPPAFAMRVSKLLNGAPPEDSGQGAEARTGSPILSGGTRHRAWLVPAIVGLVILGALALWPPWKKPETAADRKPAETAKLPAPLSEARKLELQARALIDDDPLRVRENYRTACELCERATTLSPDDADAWATYARATGVLFADYNERGDKVIAAARLRAERAIRLAPDSLEANLAKAQYAIQVGGDEATGERQLRALLERAPNDRRILRALARAAGESVDRQPEKLAESRQWAERAEALPGGDTLALTELCWGYWGLNRYQELDALLDRILARQPTSDAYHIKVMVLGAWGDMDGVLSWLEKIPPAVLSEDRVAAVAIDAYLAKRQPDKALALLARFPREFLEEGRYFSPKSYLAGRALSMAGKSRAAEIEFRSALKSVEERIAAKPNDARLFNWKGRILAQLGDLVGAAREFETGRELSSSPSSTIAPADLVLLGRYDEAIAGIDGMLQRDRSRWPASFSQLKFSQDYDPLRNDARFAALIARGDGWLREMRVPSVMSSPASVIVPAVADKSVAVLAFSNLSDEKANEYFSDGISEELLNVLAKVPGLTVRGRSSGFYFKGKQVTSAEIGRQLNAGYLVQGSVRRAGDRVRISAQLIRAATDEVVWSSGSLDRDLKDIFAVQDEIAGLIAKNLSVSMGVTARASHRVNPEALTALLEGRHFWVFRTMEGFARAGELFNRAVALDPDWAPARAALASLLAIEASYRKGGGESMSEQFALAAREAKRAIELDPSLGEPHAVLGKIAMEDRRFTEAEEEFRRALELEPNNALVVDWQGDLMVTRGRLDQAIAAYRRALELEPLSPYILWDLAWELMHVRRHAEALALVERAAALTPTGTARLSLRRARLLLELGRKPEAEAALRVYLESPRTGSDPQIANEAVWCLRALSAPAERDRWTAELLRQYPDSFASGVILLMMGREEEAYPLLEKFPTIFWQQLYWDPTFDPVRDTPRFQQLLEKLGCAAEYKVARVTLARMQQAAKK